MFYLPLIFTPTFTRHNHTGFILLFAFILLFKVIQKKYNIIKNNQSPMKWVKAGVKVSRCFDVT